MCYSDTLELEVGELEDNEVDKGRGMLEGFGKSQNNGIFSKLLQDSSTTDEYF